LTKDFIDPKSNSSPIDAIWEIYSAVKNNTGNITPGYILLSSRDSYKTASVSVLEVLLMLHFKCTVAHMAAIKSQSQKAISYINSFIRKLKPYLEHHGWELASDNKTKIQFETPSGASPYITVIIATLAGSNSEHTNILCVDGKTTIMTKNTRPSCPNRMRMKKTARGVYRDFLKGEKLETISYNHSSGEIEFKEITNAFISKQPQWELVLESGKKLTVGHSHPCFVFGKGYVEAKDIVDGDVLLRMKKTKTGTSHKFRDKKNLNRFYVEKTENTFEQVLYGSLLGDGGVYKKIENNAHYSSTHGIAQKEYLMWKKEILGQELDMHDYFVEKNGYSQKPAHRIYSGNTKTLNKIVSFRKDFEGIEKLDALGLAVWFMDDGSSSDSSNFTLHTEGFSYEQHVFLKDFLFRKFEISVDISGYTKSDTGVFYNVLRGKNEAFWRLYDICGKYIHPTMLYKVEGLLRQSVFTCRHCGETLRRIEDGSRYCFCCTKKECQSVHKKILHKDKVLKSSDAGKTKKMYDFTVKDNHNFFANGFLVSNCADELDVIPNPKAYEEAKMIPGVMNGRFPITVKLSTRKFAFGLMNNEIENRHVSGDKLLRWNIMDTAERCPATRHLPDLPKKTLYIQRELPLLTISEDKFETLEETKQVDFDKIEAFAGCENCKILPVCRTRLAFREESCVGGFYKPIDAVINLFRVNNPDIASAKLLCEPGHLYSRSLKGLNKTRNQIKDN
jgi:hypothetical protein